MDASLWWLLAGIGLIIAEVATGTFYLLFLGIAALVAAAAAYMDFSLGIQALVAALVAVLGVFWAQYRHRTDRTPAMPAIDVNQPVIWEGWVDRGMNMGRVKYRGASWDAHVHDQAGGDPGEIMYIVGVDGSTLHVAKNRSTT
ncbi:MAG TPA: NfeD family protein [Burkholderiales bacterium]|nr:NfeD family protein [Burkholderiales bacterium]